MIVIGPLGGLLVGLAGLAGSTGVRPGPGGSVPPGLALGAIPGLELGPGLGMELGPGLGMGPGPGSGMELGPGLGMELGPGSGPALDFGGNGGLGVGPGTGGSPPGSGGAVDVSAGIAGGNEEEVELGKSGWPSVWRATGGSPRPKNPKEHVDHAGSSWRTAAGIISWGKYSSSKTTEQYGNRIPHDGIP